MNRPDRKVAVVTGGSRGVGKGIALGLGEAGATVYVTGRTAVEGRSAEGLSGSLESTVKEIDALGGRGIAVVCDHTDDGQAQEAFERILTEAGRLDVLVNNVWGGYENAVEDGEYTFERPFWEQPLWRWDSMFDAGVRAHFVASKLASPVMIRQRSGLIVNISSHAAREYAGNVVFGVSKAATDRLTADTAKELKEHGVAVVSLYPGFVRTERILQASKRNQVDLENSESPLFVGRAVAALASDGRILKKTGKTLLTSMLAEEYGFTDIDGKRPKPILP